MKVRKLTCYRCGYRSRVPSEFVHIIPTHKYRCRILYDCQRRKVGRYV